jgi:hypothetical protein
MMKFPKVTLTLDKKRRLRKSMTMAEIYGIAIRVGADPRTIKKYWSGRPVLQGIASSIDKQMSADGLIR